jgi:hypothetical protein
VGSLVEWDRLLLDVLLPEQPLPERPVMLACDDEALLTAARWASFDSEDAVEQLVRVVRVEMGVDQLRGLEALYSLSAAHRRDRRRPRPVPPFLAPLCLCVLAASRMGPEGGHSTNAFYARLRDLLHLPDGGMVPGIDHVPTLLELLAEWLRDDLSGRRGQLVIPRDSPHPYVGACISQTVFRAADRRVLTSFFSERIPSLQAGIDSVSLLRQWPGRHRLTRHALHLIDDRTMVDRVRACVDSAWRVWDGAVIEPESGQRIWPARLLLVPPPRPRLLACARAGRPDEERMDVDWSELQRAAEHGLVVGPLRLPRLGPTVLFEITESGLLQMPSPGSEPLWALTREPGLAARFAHRQVPTRGALPNGWYLLGDLNPDDLPGFERVEATEARAALAIEGGLAIKAHMYLSGEPPRLVARESVQPALVRVNGRPAGSIAAGGALALPDDGPGTYQVVVGDKLFVSTYHIHERGEELGYGALSHQRLRALRGGARPTCADESLQVCGATLSIPAAERMPLMVRRTRPVIRLQVTGDALRCEPPPPPTWLAEVGLAGSPRWEVPVDHTAWVLGANDPFVRQIGDGRVECLSAEGAQRVTEIGPDAVVRDFRGQRTDSEAWTELVLQAWEVLG